MIRGLIFDFDGLIVDTEGPEYRTWQGIYRAHGQELPLEIWARCVGTSADAFDPIAYLEELLGQGVDREQIRQSHNEQFLSAVQSQGLLPGIAEYLSDAQHLGMHLAVASSSSREWVQSHLERLGVLNCFECIRARNDVALVKPHPDLYKAVLQALGLTAKEAVAFEDSLNGLKAAKAAGLRCVVIPNNITREMSLGLADIRLTSLADVTLTELLVRLSQIGRCAR